MAIVTKSRDAALEVVLVGIRLPGFVMISCATAFALGGCASRGPAQSTAAPGGATVAPTAEPTALPFVAAVPKPSLPPWIVSLSPRGEAQDGAQIRVRFATDVVPVEALESADRQSALSHVTIDPALPGHFVFLTPRMIGFEADAPIPHAARLRVTLSAGLADLAGDRLASDVAWTFTTQPLTISALPGSDPSATPQPQTRTPRIGIDTSDAVGVGSLLAHASLTDETDRTHKISLEIAPTPAPDPSATASDGASGGDASGADTGATGKHYDLVPAQQLAYDRTYDLDVAPGVVPVAGNLPTVAAYAGRVRTYGAFSFVGVTPNDSTRFDRYSALTFSNAVDETTLAKAISISPAPAKGVALAQAESDGTVDINPDALEPDTSYTVTIAPSLADTFGQTLEQTATAHLRTGDLQPNLVAPTGFRIFPAGIDLAINALSVNLPERAYRASFRVLQPRDVVANDPSTDDGVSALLPVDANWRRHPATAAKNAQNDDALPLRALLGGPLGTVAYGFIAKTTFARDANGKLVWNEPKSQGTVQVSNLGVFAQWFPDGGFVRVHHLGDGTAASNARIDVYESLTAAQNKPAGEPRPCASGVTDAHGVWRIDSASWNACAASATTDDAAPALVAIAREGADWSFARTSAYADGYSAGLDGQGWSAGTPHPRGSLVSDRMLYQPGETAKFVGLSYFETDGRIGRGRSTSFALTATTPSGGKIGLGKGVPDAFGAFSVSFDLPKRADVGEWQIAAAGSGGETIVGSFTVAEFKPPNFKVDLTLDRSTVAAGASVAARSRSTYLFGAPVEGGISHVAVTRARSYFSPAGYEAFSFGRVWSYPEEEPSVTTDVVQRDVPTDASGDAPFSVPVGSDLPYPMQYTVSAQTTDVSHLAVADTKSFTALPSDVEIGMRTAFVAQAATSFGVDAIAVGVDGKPRAGTALHVVLQQRIDASATQVVEGSETAHDAVRYVDVASQDTTTAAAPVTLHFTAAKAGDYRVRANVAGATSDATATDASLWVTGPGDASWIASENSALGVKLDKKTYRTGDVVHALIQSPFPDAELFLAVVRHGVILQRTTVVHGAAPEVTFAVTPDMLPNADVEAVLVRRGPSLRTGVPHGLAALSRIGFASFDVALDAKYLAVDVRPAAATVAPGGHEKLVLHVRTKSGAPVRGELTVAVVNDAILQLSGYRFPDLVASVYADEAISTRFADNYGDVKLASEPQLLDKGFGYGGGAMAGPPGTRVRTKFLPLAYWNAAVHTDANGDATLDVPLPDDLTTWRVMALALGPDARFGNGEATFVATKPLVTDPVLPQFARPGDRFGAGVSVTNIAHATGDLAVRAAVSGGATLATGDPHAAATTGPSTPATQAYRFDVVAAGPDDASFTFRTMLGGNADAFTFAVPIVSDDVLENTITTGTTQVGATIPIDVGADLKGPLGGLDVTLASTLLAEALEPTRTLEIPHLGFATELASRIAIASDAIVLDRRYGRTSSIPALRKSVATDLEALRALALADGGFAEWPGAKKSEVYSTAFVATQLVQARSAGSSVEPDLAHALGYLRKALADPYGIESVPKTDDVEAAEVRLEALETLGSAGDVRNDFLSDIWAAREKFGYYERIELARLLLRLPDWKTRGIALRDELFTQVNLGARHATVDVRGDFGESETAGQAQTLGLAIASGTQEEDVDRILESLLALRHDGRWGCPCDDAEAMNALVSYAAQDARPPDFHATARVPSRVPRTIAHTFSGYRVTTTTDTIAMDDLARGRGSVALEKSGRGTLHYAVALRYRVPDAVPGIYQGLRIDRIVRAAGTTGVLHAYGLAIPAGPTTVGAGLVFDVEDRVVVDHPVENVLVTDPLPAGFEAVDQSFRTSPPAAGMGDDGLAVDYQSIYRNHVISFVRHLDPGAYAIHYLVRSVTPGTFAWPGATAALQYEPEEFGRTAVTQLIVTP